MHSPELQAKVQLWRQKSREGTLTQEELREALAALREGRLQAAATSATSKARTAKTRANAAVNSDDLLNQLEGL